MLAFLKNPFENIGDRLNPLMVFELRRSYRNGLLPIASLLFLVWYCALVLVVFLCGSGNPNQWEMIFSSWSLSGGLVFSILGMYEGQLGTERQGTFKDDALALTGLTRLELFHGRMQVGFVLFAWFFSLSFLPIVLCGIVYPLFFWLLFIHLAAYLVFTGIKLNFYAVIVPYKKFWWEDTILCFLLFLLLVQSFGIFIGVLYLDNSLQYHTYDTERAVRLFWILFCAVATVAMPSVAYFLVRYFLSPPRKSVWHIAGIVWSVYTAAMVFLLGCWIVLRSFFS